MKKQNIFILTSLFVALDQLTKFLVVKNMDLYQEIKIINNFFSLYYIRNDGAAFSFLKGASWLFYIVTIIALWYIRQLFKEKPSKYTVFALTLILAGTIGNFIDRLRFQEVIDFLSFTFFGYSFATFNIADSLLTVGVILFIYDLLFNKEKE
ncbi:MAG: signal peptidase II [Bacilli bacterium]